MEILPATHRFANGQDKATLLKVLFEPTDLTYRSGLSIEGFHLAYRSPEEKQLD